MYVAPKVLSGLNWMDLWTMLKAHLLWLGWIIQHGCQSIVEHACKSKELLVMAVKHCSVHWKWVQATGSRSAIWSSCMSMHTMHTMHVYAHRPPLYLYSVAPISVGLTPWTSSSRKRTWVGGWLEFLQVGATQWSECKWWQGPMNTDRVQPQFKRSHQSVNIHAILGITTREGPVRYFEQDLLEIG